MVKIDYCCAMSDENPFENDILFPGVQKQNALQEQIRALDQFRTIMNDGDQEAFNDLIHQTEKHSTISYFAPKQSPFEYLTITMTLEIHKDPVNLA